jgi:hypothetical protein
MMFQAGKADRRQKLGKVTLTDLISLWCLFCPLMGAVMSGIKLGIAGVLVGVVVGFILSLVCFWGFRKMVLLLLRRWKDKSSIFAALAFLIISFAWLLSFTFLSIYLPRLIVQGHS